MQININFHLFLDDERHPRQVNWVKIPQNVGWTIVRSYREFVRTLAHEAKKGFIPAFISFDHDLGPEHYEAYSLAPDGATYEEVYGDVKERTGMDCLKWFVENILLPNKLPMPPHALHTYSRIGKLNMEAYIASYNKSLSA